MQLKKDNLSIFQNRLPDGIPTTFANTIQVTRAIGIRYIWIDSLCIIQDSKEDWQMEASCMDRIYEHAWCNIAATKATNSSEGLFSDRGPSTVRPVEVEARWRSHAPAKYSCWIPDLWSMNIDDSHLLHRAWVAQERILAPRVLHFAEGQIFWECCSLRACETYPLGIPNDTSFKPSLDTQSLTTDFIPYRTPALQRYRLWQIYIKMYTASKLTKPTEDKFLAISGLARKIGPPEDYAAGLWKPILAYQLRWQTGDNCTRQAEWRAPSWSWASIDGPIYAETCPEPNIEATMRIVFDILDIDVTPVTSDLFGPVLHGALRLKASLLRAVVYKSDQHPVPVCVWLGDIHAHVNLDVGSITEGQTLLFMPLRVNVHQDDPTVYGIVLEPAEKLGEFHRCGVFYVSNMRPTEHWVERLGEVLRTGSESTAFGPLVGRNETMGWKQYQVTLV
jgi:Heterokaryon incompatibility protein (HET)